MKKKSFSKKLVLKKEIVTNLNEIKGGLRIHYTHGCGEAPPPDTNNCSVVCLTFACTGINRWC